jgi:transposase
MIGLLVAGNEIPIAHYVFSGNTRESTTLQHVMTDYQHRFGVSKIALVCNRGLVFEQNLADVAVTGFDHVLATRLHHDEDFAAVLVAAKDPAATWVQIEEARSSACEVVHGGRRHVIVNSLARHRRDDHRREELLGRTESKFIALEARVREGRLVDPAKIGAAADRILRGSGVARCFSTTIRQGRFTWSFDAEAPSFEEDALAGRYEITTSLTPAEASTAQVVRYYRSLVHVEQRFEVMKDFLVLRPVDHFTEERVRGHIAPCIIATAIEALISGDLEREGRRPRRRRSNDDAEARPRRARSPPPPARRSRRARDQPCHQEKRPPGETLRGTFDQHFTMGPREHHPRG